MIYYSVKISEENHGALGMGAVGGRIDWLKVVRLIELLFKATDSDSCYNWRNRPVCSMCSASYDSNQQPSPGCVHFLQKNASFSHFSPVLLTRTWASRPRPSQGLDIRTRSRTALDYGVRENIKLRKSNSTVAHVHAINTLLNSVKVLFNIVAVLLVWQITSPARPRTCLAKAKDFCSRPRPRPRPRTTTLLLARCYVTFSSILQHRSEGYVIDDEVVGLRL